MPTGSTAPSLCQTLNSSADTPPVLFPAASVPPLVEFIEGNGRGVESYDDSWPATRRVESVPADPIRGLKEPRGYACR
jgi:hypothetical protein